MHDTNELTKQKETHRLTEQTYGFWGEGIVREFLMDMCTLLYSKLLTDKDLLNSIWSSAQCDVAARMGGGVWGRMDARIYMAGSLHGSPGTIAAFLIDYTPIQNKKFKKRSLNLSIMLFVLKLFYTF